MSKLMLRRLPEGSHRGILLRWHIIDAGLGYSGLGNKSKAREEFNTALTLMPDYLNAKIALNQLIN